jgi:DNA-binding NarL/FixJ family response regulator
VTAVSYPPAVEPAAARVVLSCSHCGGEVNLDALTDALLSALHAAPIPDGRTPPPRLWGDRAAALRPRQREILELVGEGWRVSSIATRLDIKADTVRKHLQALYTALGVHSQAELVEWIRGTEHEAVPHLRAVDAAPTGYWEANDE